MQSADLCGGVESVFLSWGKKLMSDPPKNHPPPPDPALISPHTGEVWCRGSNGCGGRRGGKCVLFYQHLVFPCVLGATRRRGEVEQPTERAASPQPAQAAASRPKNGLPHPSETASAPAAASRGRGIPAGWGKRGVGTPPQLDLGSKGGVYPLAKGSRRGRD